MTSGADLNAQEKYGATALIRATKNGYSEIVKSLVKGGADLNLTDNSRHTAFWGNL